ncbi:MAG: hypothetical protein JXB15_02370 [Anaerolineales bacterium]|nr:hypothetical protein [Anaerolineales bacterium]
MEDPSALIVPLALTALICLVIGVFVGLLLASLRSPQEKNHPAQNRDLAEVVRIWQHKRDKTLVLDLEGKQYAIRDDLSVAQHGRMVALLDALRLWLGVQEARREPQTGSVGAETTPPDASALLNLAPAEAKPRLSLNPVDILVKAMEADAPKSASANLSIAAQIDDILQKKLVDHPLRERGIRLMEMPERGLVVLVGLEEYDGVGDVPYPEIQALLRECVAEWERSVGA